MMKETTKEIPLAVGAGADESIGTRKSKRNSVDASGLSPSQMRNKKRPSVDKGDRTTAYGGDGDDGNANNRKSNASGKKGDDEPAAPETPMTASCCATTDGSTGVGV